MARCPEPDSPGCPRHAIDDGNPAIYDHDFIGSFCIRMCKYHVRPDFRNEGDTFLAHLNLLMGNHHPSEDVDFICKVRLFHYFDLSL